MSYRLHFGALQLLTGLITLGMAVVGWRWPRLVLLSAALMLWIVGYGSLHLLAGHQFRDLLSDVIADVLRTKSRSEESTPSSTPAASQQPE